MRKRPENPGHLIILDNLPYSVQVEEHKLKLLKYLVGMVDYLDHRLDEIQRAQTTLNSETS